MLKSQKGKLKCRKYFKYKTKKHKHKQTSINKRKSSKKIQHKNDIQTYEMVKRQNKHKLKDKLKKR